ncbi:MULTISPECIES: cytochrome c oxidase assembly protein [Arthrobacter]|uniref:Cytochrome c oxidase assembly protein n=2 Tax=Arthrobacter TaxID=1663 RepID=A0ABU9KNX7_9MICC|nr:cytochrome c oxidase assembly protein [Arthrobacter sp. YJM1]MDP5228618.1 cytochrome c oxidase assembly protein [Arthrobacter sp. YJM1]
MPSRSGPKAQPRPLPAAGDAVRGLGPAWQFAALAVAVVTLVLGLLFTGAAGVRQISDPGAVVRWGLPIAKTAHNISLAVTVAALAFVVFVLPRTVRAPRRTGGDEDIPEHPAFTRTLLVAGIGGAAWTLSAIAVLIFTYANVSGQPISGDSQYTNELVVFVTQLPLGQAWLFVVIVAALVATACFGLRNTTGLAFTLLLALVGMIPPALNGHAASSDDHAGAVNSIGLHVLGASLWVGGIVVLALISGLLGRGITGAARKDVTAPVLKRFSALALVCFFLVSASGVVSAAIRVTSWHDLFYSPYGQLVLVKGFCALVLGAIGYMHRAWIIPRLGGNGGTAGTLSARRVLWQVIGVELVVMAATSAVAVALSSSAPPAVTKYAEDASPAFILSGYELPPELTTERWFTEWRLDWLWVAVAVFAAAAYLLGLIKVIRRGDRWPAMRAVSWFLGLVALTYITSGAPSVYGRALFSIHMVDHMALTMVAPIFLVLGSPITLALRALSPRTDGSRGLREWTLAFVHSKFSQLVTHPLFAAANFAGSIVIFYYSDLFGFAMKDHVGHELMNLHFLLTGYIFALTMIGEDPLPRRAPFPMRLLLLLATMAFHAFFGVSIMGGTGLLAADYFGNLGRTWGPSAILDQQHGGAIAWGIGEVPTVLLAIGVAIMWSRSDERETRRKDRAADRNNDAELTAYNDMFSRLAARDNSSTAAAATPAPESKEKE